MSENDNLPAPLLSSEVDLRGLEWMPYYGDRLGRSEFNSRVDDATWRAGHNLWWAAWNNVPAASLPNDEAALTRFADLGRDIRAFRKIRDEALHGFVLCSDGRWYHPFLAELAEAAWNKRIKYGASRQGDRERLKRWREAKKSKHETPLETPQETPTETGSRNGHETRFDRSKRGEDRTGQKGSKSSVPNGTGAGAPPDDPVKALWDRGVRLLGEGGRGLFGKMRKEHGDLAVIEAMALCEDEKPSDPAAYLVKTLARRKAKNGGILPNEGVF